MRTSFAIAVAAAQLAAAHTTFQSFVIDGKDMGQHFAVQTPSNGNNPILDVTSTAMNCNGGKATTDFVEAKAGSEVTFQWHHNDPQTQSGDQDEPIAKSHQGPVMVYMAKADTNGEGAVWTKIFEEGLNAGTWAIQKFIDNKGQITVKLPDLEDGEYLIRPEMIALHEGNRAKGAQFYNGCGQIKVSGGSVALPASGTDMTKAYSATDPGVLFDIYAGKKDYPIPGPRPMAAGASGSSPATPTKPSASATPSPASPSAPAATSAAPAAPAPATPSKPAASASPAPAPPAGGPAGSLPETFTITQFISWLKEQTGSSAKARRHARAFAL